MSSSSSSVSSSSSPRGFQAARERLNLQKQHDREGNGGMDVFLKRTDAGRYLSSLFFEKDDNTKWILNVAGVLFLCVMCVFALAGFEHVFRGGGGGVVVEAKPPVLSEREEEKEEEVKEEEEKTTTKTLSVESIQNMTEDELRVLELSVKMRDVLSKEKSNALREARLSVERKQLEAKLAGLDLKKESNETMKTTNDMKRESLEFKMKLNREKVFREDVADALRTGLVVVCGALVYFGWNVIRDAWLNESEICYSSSSSSFFFVLVDSFEPGVFFRHVYQPLGKTVVRLQNVRQSRHHLGREFILFQNSRQIRSPLRHKLHRLPAFLHSVNSRRRRRVPWSQIRPIFTRRRVCVSLFVDDVCCYRFPRERIRRSPRSGDFTVHFEEGTF